MVTILDASALLAYLKDEPGSDAVKTVLSSAAICSVNWTEVVQKAIGVGVDIDAMLLSLSALGLTVEPFTLQDGTTAGRLWSQTKDYGLSLGDRACLSLALRLGASVLTSDRAWGSLDVSVDIQLIR